MQGTLSEDFFINTLRRKRSKECPSSAVIAGANGALGLLLGRALREKGCEVSLFAKQPDQFLTEEAFYKGELSTIFNDDHAKVFQEDSVLYLFMYSLEPFDIALSDTDFVHKLRERALSAGFSRIVLVTSVVHPDRPDMEERLRRLLHVIGGGHKLPVTHFKTSLLLGRVTELWRVLERSQVPVLILPSEARAKECSPLYIDDLITYLSLAHDAELPRNYTFEVGGEYTLTFEEITKHIMEEMEKSIRVTTSVGIRELFTKTTFDRAVKSSDVLKRFVDQTRFSMRASTSQVRSYYPEVTPQPVFGD